MSLLTAAKAKMPVSLTHLCVCVCVSERERERDPESDMCPGFKGPYEDKDVVRGPYHLTNGVQVCER